jgi:hypothetical protein
MKANRTRRVRRRAKSTIRRRPRRTMATNRTRRAAPKRKKAARKAGKRRQTAAQKRASLANLRKARAARKGTTKRRAKRRTTKKTVRRAAPKRRVKRTTKRRTAKRTMRRNGRQTAAQRRASLRNLRKARAAKRPKRRAGKRRLRRNAWYGQPAKHRKAAKKGWGTRKSRYKPTAFRKSSARRKGGKMRRNGSYMRNALYRRNGILQNLTVAAKAGGLVVGGLVGHKVVQKVFSDFVLSKIFGAPATAQEPVATPPATAGLEALEPYKGLIAGGIAAAAGILITTRVVKDTQTRNLIAAGMAASFLHTLLMTIVERVSPPAVNYLSGYDDGTAARLSAMYGFGASIQPRYAAINGMGEYFSESGVSGLGEYFSEGGVSGLGEYFSEGLGQYGQNPDLYQAAAGYGQLSAPTNHISPNGDLERELSIAEAAAGVGMMPMQAAAGFGRVQPFEAQAGMGAIQSLPSADTWIPGMADPQLWAGVRPISRPQSASAMVPAGILQTDGGQGIFG